MIYLLLTVLFYHAYIFFLIIDFFDFHYLIHAVITQIFNPAAAIEIPIGMSINEAKAEILLIHIIEYLNIFS